MALYPSLNDRDFDLWKKTAYNLYELALARGYTGFNPPNWNDTVVTLQKKIAYYTAKLAGI